MNGKKKKQNNLVATFKIRMRARSLSKNDKWSFN